MNNFEELSVWQKSVDFVAEVYKLVSDFPKVEKYGLTTQIKRSAISIPSNIAEGSGRNSDKEFLYFLSVATGSSYELHTQIILTQKLGLIDKEKTQNLISQLREIQKMIHGLQKYLQSKKS